MYSSEGDRVSFDASILEHFYLSKSIFIRFCEGLKEWGSCRSRRMTFHSSLQRLCKSLVHASILLQVVR